MGLSGRCERAYGSGCRACEVQEKETELAERSSERHNDSLMGGRLLRSSNRLGM